MYINIPRQHYIIQSSSFEKKRQFLLFVNLLKIEVSPIDISAYTYCIPFPELYAITHEGMNYTFTLPDRNAKTSVSYKYLRIFLVLYNYCDGWHNYI